MELIFKLLKQRLFYVIIVIVYIVNSAMSYNERYNAEKVEAYYSSFATNTNGPGLTAEEADIDELITFAKEQLGKPYRPSAKGPDAFDCSGFTGYVFKKFDVYLPASASAQARVGIHVDKEGLLPGDLVFFKGSNLQSNAIGHVGIVTEAGEDEIKFIHSSTSKGIMINDLLQDEYYNLRYKGARRVMIN